MKKELVMIFILMFAISFAFAAQENAQSKNNSQSQSINQYQKGNLTQAQIGEIIQNKNRLRIQAQNQECPSNCSCDGSTIKCQVQTQNGTQKQMTIQAGNSGNTIVQVKNANMSTQVQLYKSDDGKVYAQFQNNETKEIILPDEIKTRIEARLRERVKLQNENMTLNEDGEYQIRAEKRARLLWIIPVQERVNAQVDAETGEILRQRNSWWGFLARDVSESNSTE